MVSDGESDQTVVENSSPVSVRKLSTSKFSLPDKKKTYGGPVKSTKTYGGDENLLQQSSAKSSQKATKEKLSHIGSKMFWTVVEKSRDENSLKSPRKQTFKKYLTVQESINSGWS